MAVDQQGNVLYEGVQPDAEPQTSSSQLGRDTEIIGETDGGKQIQVRKDPTFAGYSIEFTQGGEIPSQLQGRWTSYEKAVSAVKDYLAQRNSVS